jgi:putative oxidoreductase
MTRLPYDTEDGMEQHQSGLTQDSFSSANAPGLANSVALLILRLASAMAFLYHGGGILFGAFGGPGPQQFAAFHHWPAVLGYLVGLAQFCGGLAVLSGVLFRFGAACIIAVMLGAIFMVHLPNGFDVGHGGAEYALTQLLLAVAFLFSGPGRYSLALLLPGWLQKL